MEQDAHGTTLFNMPAVQAMLTSLPESVAGRIGGTATEVCDSHTAQQQQQQGDVEMEDAGPLHGEVVHTTLNMGRQGATLLAQLVAQLDCRTA